jgi:alpha-beta hydrolase superfamily lysophospholipase
LAASGWDTWFLDRRGSGRNDEARGDCKGFRQLRDDLVGFLGFVRRELPGRPVALVAISWGGKLAMTALAARPELVNAVAFLCPGWFSKIDLSLRQKLNIAAAYFMRSRRPIDIPLSDPALFTATPRWQEFLRNDPLSLRQGTARLLVTSRLLDRVIARLPERVACPALLMLAGRDRIIDNERSRQYLSRCAGPTTILEYPDAHHTLEFEPDPTPIFGDLLDWLGQKTGQV